MEARMKEKKIPARDYTRLFASHIFSNLLCNNAYYIRIINRELCL